MSPVSYTHDDNVVTISLDDGKANVISPTVLAAINAALDVAESEGAVVVLRGREGMFSGGFDLSVLSQGAEAATDLMLQGSALSRRLMTFPCPVIAACTGHAVAMGAFYLMSCDYRIGLEGPYKLGLNEVAMGLTMPQMGLELARLRLNQRYLQRAVVNAEMFAPAVAMDAGFLDQVESPERFEEAIARQVKQLGALHPGAFRQTKLKTRKPQLEILDWANEVDAKELPAMLAALF